MNLYVNYMYDMSGFWDEGLILIRFQLLFIAKQLECGKKRSM